MEPVFGKLTHAWTARGCASVELLDASCAGANEKLARLHEQVLLAAIHDCWDVGRARRHQRGSLPDMGKSTAHIDEADLVFCDATGGAGAHIRSEGSASS